MCIKREAKRTAIFPILSAPVIRKTPNRGIAQLFPNICLYPCATRNIHNLHLIQKFFLETSSFLPPCRAALICFPGPQTLIDLDVLLSEKCGWEWRPEWTNRRRHIARGNPWPHPRMLTSFLVLPADYWEPARCAFVLP